MRKAVALGAIVSLFLAVAAHAEMLQLDMQRNGDVTAAGWVEVDSRNRFDKPLGHAEETADLGSGMRGGYNGWAQANERDRNDDASKTWPSFEEVLRDFSGPKSSASARFIIWNVPAGDYYVTAFMRDWQYGGGATYRLVHEGASDTLFTVVHNDAVDGDPSSTSDTQTVSTVVYDPDGAATNYDAQPSLVFKSWVSGTGSVANSVVNGYLIDPVPEPATMSLLALGLLGLLKRRRK